MLSESTEIDDLYEKIINKTKQEIHIRLLVDADFPMVPCKMDLEEVMRDHFLYKNVLYGDSIFRITNMQMKDADGESKKTPDGVLLLYGEKSLCIDLLFYDLFGVLNNVRLYGDSFQRKMEMNNIGEIEWVNQLIENGTYTHEYTRKRYTLKSRSFAEYLACFTMQLFNIKKICTDFWYGYKG